MNRKELENLSSAKMTESEKAELGKLLKVNIEKALKDNGLTENDLENHTALVLRTVVETIEVFMEKHDLSVNEGASLSAEIMKSLEAANARKN